GECCVFCSERLRQCVVFSILDRGCDLGESLIQVRFADPKLESIAAKIAAGERLSFDEGVILYRTQDLLGVGYLANRVRERLHGNTTWFNVNRHVNPTDVCVASCRLCAFGKGVRDESAYTMTHEEVWHRA